MRHRRTVRIRAVGDLQRGRMQPGRCQAITPADAKDHVGYRGCPDEHPRHHEEEQAGHGPCQVGDAAQGFAAVQVAGAGDEGQHPGNKWVFVWIFALQHDDYLRPI
jgi:hypothetical protein